MKTKNVCRKCGYKWLGLGWKGYYTARCPKCGAHTSGFVFVNFLIVVAVLVLLGLVPDNTTTDTVKLEAHTVQTKQTEESKQIQKNEDVPDFVVDGKLVWQIPVCRYSDDFYEYLHAVTNKDYETTKTYEKRYRCFMLKPGVRVSVLKLHMFKPVKIRAYKDGDMLDVYTAPIYIKGAE